MFDVNDDLQFQQVLSEPDIAQPVFLNFDERGRMWVVEYRQYPEVAGLKVVSRDKFYRSVFDKIPVAPPHHDRGADRISIHEDTDGDGSFDQHKIFVDGLNICTAVERGRGGVWVLNPPYLLFYPDADQDDVPDADPQVLLSGFGLEDTHSVVNSLRWGPDGWLYAAQGSTVSGHVVRPGTDDQPLHSMGQLIWRYHPETHHYEIFAEGGGNAFGVELDDKGRIFSGHNGGNTRGFHYMQGAYLQKGFSKHGPLSNPFAFGYFPPMQHPDVERFTHNFVINQSTALPEKYRGKLFGVEPLQGRIVQAEIVATGSTFQTVDIDRPVTSRDEWFRPVDIKIGPGGAIYVCDWYDSQVSHLRNTDGTIDKSNGRIYRLAGTGFHPGKSLDLRTLTIAQLIEQLKSVNRWERQIALRVIGDRSAEVSDAMIADWKSQIQTLDMTDPPQAQFALELLWAVHLCRGIDDTDIESLLKVGDPFVRLWTVRLACDDRRISNTTAARIAELAAKETNIEVRSQIACSAKRLPSDQALGIVKNLLVHDADLDDPRQPLLLWWAIEAHCATDPATIVRFWQELDQLQKRPLVSSFLAQRLMQRFAAAGTRRDMLICAQLFNQAIDQTSAEYLLAGFKAGVKGRSIADLPEETMTALAATGIRSLALELRRKQGDAIKQTLQAILNDKTPIEERVELVQIFGQIQEPDCVDTLLQVIEITDQAALRSAAISSLANYQADEIGHAIIKLLPKLDAEQQQIAVTMLTSRQSWTSSLLQAVAEQNIKQELLDRSALQRALTHQSTDISAMIEKLYGSIAGRSDAQMIGDINQYLGELQQGEADRYAGKKIFNEQCAKCHRLFESDLNDGQFGFIGPDLTSYQRTDLRNMLINVVNPSAQIREGFEQFLVETADGRSITGFRFDEDSSVVVLRGTDGNNVIVAKDDIELIQALPTSLMPEGILQKLTEQQRRDLFAYLQSTQPLND
jgi:putative heme-binding domain-containing protein